MDIKKAIYEKVRAEGKEDSTAEAYYGWTRRYLDFCRDRKLGKETPAEEAVEQFLSMLANRLDVSAATQNQAFSALCYFYAKVRERPLVNVSALRAKPGQTVRNVADQSEILAIFEELDGIALTVARMMYGCNFRIGEIGKLRIKDISFERKQVAIHAAKGKKDRIVAFPEVLHSAVERQIDSMRVLHRHDVAERLNGVSLPHAWGRKSPSSRLEFGWYYLFSADDYSKCPLTGTLYRHHRDMGNVARRIKQAAQRAGIEKRITSHCLRHSFATHSLEGGVPIHVVKELMGHTSIETTQTYAHVAKDGITAARNPLQQLLADPELAKANRAKPAEPFRLQLYTG